MSIIPEEMKKFKLEEWCSAITGGNILHRMHCTIERMSAMINHIPTISTHLHLDSRAGLYNFLSTYTSFWTNINC